jgi:hypothetical protein
MNWTDLSDLKQQQKKRNQNTDLITVLLAITQFLRDLSCKNASRGHSLTMFSVFLPPCNDGESENIPTPGSCNCHVSIEIIG